jgi:hypothetical protein
MTLFFMGAPSSLEGNNSFWPSPAAAVRLGHRFHHAIELLLANKNVPVVLSSMPMLEPCPGQRQRQNAVEHSGRDQ